MRALRTLGRCTALLTVLFSSLPVAASAQLSELQQGTKVRIRADGEVAGRLTGVVITRSTDSLTVSRPNASPITLALAKLTSIEVSRGKSRGRGALKGMVWGAATGVLLGLTPISDSTCTGGTLAVRGTCEPVSRAFFMATILGGSIPFGALVGAVIGSERWEGGMVPARVSVLPPTRAHSAGVALTWVASGPRRLE